MDAERERHVHPVSAHATGTFVDARKAGHRELDVLEAAWIEQRAAGGAAGAPIFGDPVGRLQAKSFIEARIGQAAQDVLGKDGNLAPLVRIVELVQLDMVKLAGIEGCAARLLYRAPLPRALNVLD